MDAVLLNLHGAMIAEGDPDAAPIPQPKLLSDEELFAAAVKDVSGDAVLDKFGAGSAPASSTVSSQPKPPPKTEAEVFQDFLGFDKKR